MSISVPGWWGNLPRCGVAYKIGGCQVVPRSGAEDSKLRTERMGRKRPSAIGIFRRLPVSRKD